VLIAGLGLVAVEDPPRRPAARLGGLGGAVELGLDLFPGPTRGRGAEFRHGVVERVADGFLDVADQGRGARRDAPDHRLVDQLSGFVLGDVDHLAGHEAGGAAQEQAERPGQYADQCAEEATGDGGAEGRLLGLVGDPPCPVRPAFHHGGGPELQLPVIIELLKFPQALQGGVRITEGGNDDVFHGSRIASPSDPNITRSRVLDVSG
jgi:hypothetical protein